MKMTAKAVLMVLLLGAAGMTNAKAQGTHAYVDLGLPSGLLWATCNVGADTPEGYGSYFAWGETEPKDYYDWNTYQHCNGDYDQLTKYCSNASYGYNGFTDGLTVLLPEDDAATANWGEGWRMPTKEEWEELRDNTTVEWTTQNGVAGRRFTAANGNSLFLPAAGNRWGGELNYAGSDGYYWSSSLHTVSPNYAWYFYFNSGYYYVLNSYRDLGRSVRAVREDLTLVPINAVPNPEVGGTIEGAGSYAEGSTCTLTAMANTGYTFQNWTTEDGEVVSVENPYTFTVAGERSLVANFVEHSTHWTPNGTDYEENMPVTAVVAIDGEERQSATLELGAFSGEECRGSQTPLYFGPTQRYVYQMTVFGEEGDEIAFRLYDHATNEELELVAPEPVAFDILGYGTLPNPVVLNFRHSYAITATANPEEGGTVNGGGTYIHGETCTLTATPNDGYVFVHWTLDGEVVSTEAEYTFEVTGAGEYTAHFNLVQTTTFNQGWNWWSSYVELNGSYGLEALENGLDANGVMIKSQNDGYVSYSEELGWYGSLVELYNEQSYRVKADAACTVQLQGSLTNPADHPVTLNPGWTWMGFPWNQAMSVEAALEGFEPEANDFIKGRNAYTMYYAENGYSMWFGPLNSLEPGQGYVYYSNSDEAKTLTFNTNGGRSAQPNVTADDNLFRPETGNYADNMTLTAVVSLNGKELRSEDYEVAAFCNGECRGSAKLAYFAPKDSYVAFLTLYGNDGDELELVLTDGTTTACQGDALRFDADGRIGTLSEPHKLSFGATGIDDHGAARVSVYPNPTKDVFNVEGEGIRRVDVFNAFGQEVLVEETTKEAFRIDLSDKAAGVYMLRVVTESGVMTRQLVKE